MNMELNRKQAPAYHQIKSINIPRAESGLLDNKMPYTVLSGGSQEIVSIELSFDAGICSSNQLLVATFANMMLLNGTKHHNAQQIADAFDYYGADVRTDRSFDRANISLFCLNKHLDKLLPLFCEIIEDSVYAESELKTTIANEKHKFIINHSKTSTLANDAMFRIVFDKHPYGRRAQLTDYDKISSDILRDFHAKHYCAANGQLLIAGYVTDSVMKAVNSTIGQIKYGQKTETAAMPLTPMAGPKTEIIKKSDAVQSSLRMCSQSIKLDHPDSHLLNMLVTVLGGYFGARLMTNIRKEKGYTYGIYSVLQPLAQGGLLRIFGDIKSGYSSVVVDEVKKEMQKLKDEPISADELGLVKNYMMGEMLQMFDGPFNCCDAVAKAISLGPGLKYFEDEQAAILNAKSSDLQALANKYFDFDQMATIIAGNE